MSDEAAPVAWPLGDGEMAGRIRAHDWACTPLGPIEDWPQSLKTVVDLMMANPVANILVCGSERVLIYNDACILLYGDKHPGALGSKGPDVFPELWDEIGPLYDRVFAGEQLRFRAQPWAFDRGAAPRAGLYDAYFTPGRDETGQVAFAYVTAIEVTDREFGEAALRESEERQAFLLKLSDALRAEPDADAVAERAIRMLSEQIRLDRCYIASYRPADDRADITHQVGNDGVPALPDMIRLSDFPAAFRQVFDQTLVIDDVAQTAGLSETDRRNIEALGLRALIAPTLRKGENNPLWVIVAVSARPRRWTRGEIALAEEVGERTWAAVERAQAEVALRKSEEQYRLLFDSIDEGFCVVEVLFDHAGKPVDYRFLQANPAFERQTGLTDAIGRRTIREMAPDHEEHWYEIYGRIALTGEPARFEHEAAALGHWYDVYAFRIGEPGERRVAILFTDILARKEAELALREREQRFRALVDASSDVVYRMSPDWSEMRHLVGRDFIADTEDPSSTWLDKYIHPDDQQRMMEGINAAIEAKDVFDLEHRVIRVDGTLGWTHSRAAPLLDENREIVEWIGMAADITVRKSAEEALRESEERFRQFGDASSDVLWIRDAERLQWEYLSPAFETTYGKPLDEALSSDTLRNWLDLILPEDREHALDNIRRVREGEAVTFEYRIRRPSDGAIRWLRNTDFPLFDQTGRVQRIGGIGHDATEEKEAADRMHVLVAELQHRTRNLVAVVGGLAARTAKESTSLEEFRVRFGDRLAAIARVQGLLSRLGDGQRVTFDELLDAELAAHGALDKSNHRVALDGPSGVLLRSSTVQTFALALHELATNAVKYGALSSPDGYLGVRWHIETNGAARQLHVEWRESGVVMPDAGAEARGGGYGRELIERALPYQLNAQTSYELRPDGVRCTITVPIAGATAEGEEDG